ncbi:MAG: PTS sugar transporter subunit IIA [Alphaproteobacteria bacterium]|nr:PTS sugar transporter subunit IIA [Alphaproteobacteria bacterium]
MKLEEFTVPEGVIAGLRATTKAQALAELARRGSQLAGVGGAAIEKALHEREQLGSTGIGRGVALPHARIPGLKRLVGVFARLQQPIEFDAIDQQPVDLLFLLLAPENTPREQIAALARISHLFRDAGACEALRKAPTSEAIYAIIKGQPASEQAKQP